MKTSRPFATISYNTSLFLQKKLGHLVATRVLAFYAFVEHYPETDETKRHKHLFIMPNGQYCTDNLIDLLAEIDINNPNSPPLGVMPFRASKWDDWYLYACHDIDYLATKGLDRFYHYSQADFITSNDEFFAEMVHTINRRQFKAVPEFIEAVRAGVSFEQLLAKGCVPINQFLQYKALYCQVAPVVRIDPETGEYQSK